MSKKPENCPYCGEDLQEFAEYEYNDGFWEVMDKKCPFCSNEIYIYASGIPEFHIEKT